MQVGELNVQNQQKTVWPAHLTVARAYVDQLERSQALPADRIAALNTAIAKAQKSHLGKKDAEKLKELGSKVQADAASAKTPADTRRMHALADILAAPAA